MANSDTTYFEHGADIGIIGRGQSLSEAFVSAAQATFAIMLDLSKIKPEQHIQFEFKESDLELALVTWLNNLLAEARIHHLALAKFSLKHNNNTWTGQAWGESMQTEFINGSEVKGATLTMLAVTQFPDTHWEARCVVDV